MRVGSSPRAFARAMREPQPEQVGGGEQHAVGVDREGAELKQVRDACSVVRAPGHVEQIDEIATPIVMAASATLNAQKCQPRQYDVHEVDDVALARPIDRLPRRRRGSAPDPTRASRCVGGQAAPRRAATPTSATSATSAITRLEGKSAAFRNPNAAPVLRTCVRSSNPGSPATLSCSAELAHDQQLRQLVQATTMHGAITGHSVEARRRRAGCGASRPRPARRAPPRSGRRALRARRRSRRAARTASSARTSRRRPCDLDRTPWRRRPAPRQLHLRDDEQRRQSSSVYASSSASVAAASASIRTARPASCR